MSENIFRDLGTCGVVARGLIPWSDEEKSRLRYLTTFFQNEGGYVLKELVETYNSDLPEGFSRRSYHSISSMIRRL